MKRKKLLRILWAIVSLFVVLSMIAWGFATGF